MDKEESESKSLTNKIKEFQKKKLNKRGGDDMYDKPTDKGRA